jgi:hypothetical protein
MYLVYGFRERWVKMKRGKGFLGGSVGVSGVGVRCGEY